MLQQYDLKPRWGTGQNPPGPTRLQSPGAAWGSKSADSTQIGDRPVCVELTVGGHETGVRGVGMFCSEPPLSEPNDQTVSVRVAVS
jgi:hypothetical protein